MRFDVNIFIAWFKFGFKETWFLHDWLRWFTFLLFTFFFVLKGIFNVTTFKWMINVFDMLQLFTALLGLIRWQIYFLSNLSNYLRWSFFYNLRGIFVLVIEDDIKVDFQPLDHVLEWHEIEHVVINDKNLWSTVTAMLSDHLPTTHVIGTKITNVEPLLFFWHLWTTHLFLCFLNYIIVRINYFF